MKLTRERLMYVLELDNEWVFRWRNPNPLARGCKVGAVAGRINRAPDRYNELMIDGVRYPTHKLVWFYVYGEWPEGIVDHWDGNKLNNHPGNLRLTDKSGNNWNAKKRKDNTSGVKGVAWKKSLQKWYAHIQVKGKKLHLGYYADKEAAAQAVQAARDHYHGEFARHG